MSRCCFLLLKTLLCSSILICSARKNFVLDKSDSHNAEMIVVGDWGGCDTPPYYYAIEKATANAMMKYSKVEDIDFVLALGDNFYSYGVVNENDVRFQETYEKVFNDPSFLHIPWYILAGNHDHYGNITGQLAYSKHSTRWNFPDLWYLIKVVRPTFNMSIIMIDTVTLCGNTLLDEEGSQPDGKIDHKVEKEQLKFIENQLKHNKDQYLIVAGHFPVWSIGESGPTKCLVKKLKPLLEKYNVNTYLCGHDHDLQHIREPKSAVEYFVSGTGDKIQPTIKHADKIPKDSLLFYWANAQEMGAFATINATKYLMNLAFHSASGDVLYQYEMYPRHN